MAKASRPGNQAVAGIAGTSTTSPTFYKSEAAGSTAGSTKSSSSGAGSSSNKSSSSNKIRIPAAQSRVLEIREPVCCPERWKFRIATSSMLH